MGNGRLIRVKKLQGPEKSVGYVVALADSAKAIELIRPKVADPADQIEDTLIALRNARTALALRETSPTNGL